MNDQPSILVTGCSTGIGAHCANRLHDDGWRVFATARRKDDLARLRAEGLEAFHLELRNPQSIASMLDEVLAASSGTLDAVFNNAGYAQPGAVEDISMDCLREQMEVNFFAYHQIALRLIPVMRAQGRGRIINCSSVLGRVNMPWRGAYNASKHALEALTITLRQELEGSNIFASIIEPGPIPSHISVNAVKYAEKYVDLENSVHAEGYGKRLDDLKRQLPPEDLSGAEPVYKALHHALTARRPKPHYPVTWQTRLSFAAKRLLPKDVLYRLLATQA